MKLRRGRPDQFWISVASSFLVPSSSSPTAQSGSLSSCGGHKNRAGSTHLTIVVSRDPTQEPRFRCVIHLHCSCGPCNLRQIHELQIRLYREISSQFSPVLFFLVHRDLSALPWPQLTTRLTRILFLPMVRTMYACRLSRTSIFTEEDLRQARQRSPTTHRFRGTLVGMNPHPGNVPLPLPQDRPLSSMHLLCLLPPNPPNLSTRRVRLNSSILHRACNSQRSLRLVPQAVVAVRQILVGTSPRVRSGVHAPTRA